ncbi:MAG: hypothetical protein AB8F78_07025 [Saprospiraceae bacterium]
MKSEDQKLIDQLLNPQAGSLTEEYQQELSYRFAQEVRLRIQKQYDSVSDFAEKNNLDRHQISRQLSGTSNLTLKSIARIAAALKEPLVNVCGRPSYRFEEAKLPIYARSALEFTAKGVDNAYSNVSLLPLASIAVDGKANPQKVLQGTVNSFTHNSCNFQAIPLHQIKNVQDVQSKLI